MELQDDRLITPKALYVRRCQDIMLKKKDPNIK